MDKVDVSTIQKILESRIQNSTDTITFREFCCELVCSSNDFTKTYVDFLLLAVFYGICEHKQEIFGLVKHLRESLSKIKDDIVAKQTILLLDACCGCTLRSNPLNRMRKTYEYRSLAFTLGDIEKTGLWPRGKDKKGKKIFTHVSIYQN